MKTKSQQNIVVLDRGWVYVGDTEISGDTLTIRNARNIRRWGTTKGLGQLAQSGPTDKTQLDPAGTIVLPIAALNHLIQCQTRW